MDILHEDFLPNTEDVVNVKHDNEVIQGDFFQLPFTPSFNDCKDYVKFLKAVEKLVRQSDAYKGYINYLKTDIGLTNCSILTHVNGDNAKVEMHHGPILTLFDYCDIVTNALVNRKEKFNTVKVAKIILEEHYLNNVQVVMLSTTVHQLVHTGKMFIHPSQAWGDVNRFLEKFQDGITEEQINIINEYIRLSTETKTNDAGLLKVQTIKDWNVDGHTLEEV